MIRFQSDHLIENVWNNISEIIIYLFSVKFRYILNLLFNSIFFSFCKRTGFERKVNKSSFNFFFWLKKGYKTMTNVNVLITFKIKLERVGFTSSYRRYTYAQTINCVAVFWVSENSDRKVFPEKILLFLMFYASEEDHCDIW